MLIALSSSVAFAAPDVTKVAKGASGTSTDGTYNTYAGGSTTSSGSDSINFNNNASTSNKSLMLVLVSMRNANGNSVSSITYNNVALTYGGATSCNGGSTYQHIEAWYLLSPAAGSNTLALSYAQSISQRGIFVQTFENVNQTNPIGNLNHTCYDTNTTSFSISLGQTVSAENSLVVGTVGQRQGGTGGVYSPGSGVTETVEYQDGSSTGTSYDSYVAATMSGTNSSFSYTSSNTDRGAVLAVEIRPYIVITQAAYRFFANANSTTPGSPLAAQNTVPTLTSNGQTFRLRVVLAPTYSDLVTGQNLILQYVAVISGTSCSGTWNTVTSSSPIALSDNAGVANGATAVSNANDPTDGGNSIAMQYYADTSATTSARNAIAKNSDGLWDFSLLDNTSVGSYMYCLRMAHSDGTALSSYTNVIKLITAPSQITQSGYRWFANADSAVPGATLAAINASATSPAVGTAYRLRMLLHTAQDMYNLAYPGTYKLQYAAKSGTCDTGFSGESYADVGSSTAIKFHDNGSVTDGSNVNTVVNDPTHNSDVKVVGLYKESNTFGIGAFSATAGKDLIYDFALTTDSTANDGGYCLRVVNSNGTSVYSYNVVPEIVVDNAPTVTGVSATNGSYKAGDIVPITVTFSEAVTVTGTPQLTLNPGTSYAVNYTSGSGTNALVFNYTVQAGHTASDLDYVGTTSLGLNSGTIKDSTNNNATLTLASPGASNSLGASSNVIIDGVAPTVANITSNKANGSYKAGEVIDVRVRFSEEMAVTGTPQLTLSLGGDVVVDYASLATTSVTNDTLVFNYTVSSGHTSADLDYKNTTALALNSGTIKDVAGNSATLTLVSPGTAGSLGANKAIVIDATAPDAPSITSPTTGSTTGDSTPDISGTAEANSTVEVFRAGSTSLGTTTADGSGNWTLTSSTLSAGTHTITAKATDAAGNVSSASTSITLTYSQPTVTQSAYRFYSNANSATPGSALAAQDTAATLGNVSEFRLRMLVHVGTAPIDSSYAGFKLQAATKGASCAASTFGDVGTGDISFNDNAGVTDGSALSTSGSDPTHSGHAVRAGRYQESNNFTANATIASGEDGIWDFALLDYGWYANTTYCFRIVKSDGSTLDSYSVYPEITTSDALLTQSSHRWYANTNTIAPGTAIAADNTEIIAPANGTPYRMRLLIQTEKKLLINAKSFKLQYAARSGTCDTSFAGETYADVTSSTPISFYDNAAVANGANISVTMNDPVAIITYAVQNYQEANNFSNAKSAVNDLAEMEWDFALVSASSAVDGTAYCLRAVKSNGTVLDTYSYIPQVTVDAAPTVTDVTASTANGSYKAGDVVTITVGFSENVTVTGTPQLALNSGATVNYSSGSGTSTLTFTYTVGASDNATDLDYTDTTALTLNGGTIKDSTNNNATLTLATPGAANSLGANKDIVIDTTAPTVSDVSATTANGSYKAGDVIAVTIQFTEAVTVTGTPQLTLRTGMSSSYDVNYSSGSGTDTLTFNYTVQAGHSAPDLDYVTINSLTLNGGTIKDTGGNNATLTLANPNNTHSLAANKEIVIDTSPPVLPYIASPVTDSYTTDTTPTISGEAESDASITVYRGGSTSICTTVADNSGAWSCDSVTLSEGSYTLTAKAADAAGNVSPASDPVTLTIDQTAPTVSEVSASTVDGTYKAGDVINVTVQFSEAVTVSGTPRLTLAVGGGYAVDYTSGSSTDTLTFAYTVQSGHTSSDLDYSATNSLALNGGTIKDATNNDATLTLASSGATHSLAANKALVIDTTAPSAPSITSPTDGTTTADETPSFEGTAEANSTVEVFEGVSSLGTTTANGSGDWTFTPSSPLADATYSITAKATDEAGNTSAASTAISITVGTATPEVSNVSASTANGSYNAGDVINVTVTFSEAVTVTGTPQLTLAVGGGYAVDYTSGSGTNTLTFAYTVQSGHTSSDLDYSVTNALALNSGTIKSTATSTDATLTLASPGAAGSLGANKALVVDTTAPNAPTITSPSDGDITSDTTPDISGTAEANSTVELFRAGSTSLGTTTADGSGNWSLSSDTLTEATHTLTAKATDAAGNVSSASTGVSLTVDASAPTVSEVSASTANGSYNADDVINITVQFSETVTVTGTPRLTLAVGAGYAVNYASGSGTDTLTFAYTVQSGHTSSDLDYSATNSLALNSGTIKDGANNNATLTLASPGATHSLAANKALVIDTTAPSAPSITSPTDGTTTADDTPSFSGASEAGATVEVFRGGSTSVCSVAADGSGNWSCDASSLSDGTYSTTAKATDAAGNTSAASTAVSITIDTAAPAAPVITAPTNGTKTNDTTPTITGTSEANADITVYRGGSTSICTTTADGSGDWSCDSSALAEGTYSITAKATDAQNNTSTASTAVSITVDTTAPSAPAITSPTDGTTTADDTPTFEGTAEANSTVEVFEGVSSLGTTTADGSGDWTFTPGSPLSDATYSITAKASDDAGNTSAASSAVSITISTAVPEVSNVSASTANGSYNAGDVIDVTVTFSEAVTVTGTPLLTLAVDGGYPVNYTSGSGTPTLTFAYTVQSGHTSSDLDYSATNSLALNSGTIKSTATSTDAILTLASPGAAGSLGANKALVIDTTAPNAPAITSPTDGTTTADDTPAFSGTAEANSTVELFRGGSTSIGTTTANGSGAWTLTPGVALADGTYSITAKATDGAGNTGAASSAVSVTVDTTAPAAPVITAPVDGARIIDTTPTITGTSEANADITVYRGGSTSICTTTADGSGDWSCDSSSLAEGTYSITAKATDAQNNTSAASTAVSITVDTTAPSAPAITSPTDGTTTADNTPTFSGTAEANSTLEIFRGGSTSLGTTTTNGSGAWTLTPGATITDGTHSITAKATDAAGNTSVASAAVSVTIDTAAPVAPVITDPIDGAETNDATPTITGTSEAYADITVYRGGSTSICTTTADGSGDWSCDSSSLAEGTYSITAKATDAQNNTSVASTAVSITVDTTAPSAPAITSPTDGTTTADDTPSFSGTAEASSTVEIFEGVSSLGTTTADGSGNWTYTTGSPLSDATYSVTAKATDEAGNTSAASTAVSVTVDTSAPAAPVITAPTDGAKTNDTTPTITGTAEANADIAVYRGGSTSICTTTADGSGDWSCDSSSLAEGTYSITAKATDAQNNTSTASTAVSITIDTTAPSAPAITSPTDGAATADTTPTFSGTAEANASVEVFEGVASLGTTSANGSGAWTFTPGTPLADATYSVTAKATDAAGNTSGASTAVSLTILTESPEVTNVSASTANGSYNAGDVINVTVTFSQAVTVTGTPRLTLAVGGGYAINYTSGGGTTTLTFAYTVQSGHTSSDLDYSATNSLALNSGTIKSTATSTDATLTLVSPGAAGSLAANKALVIDTTSPSAPAITAPTDGTTTADNTPAFSGTAEANSTVEVFRGGNTSLGTTTANGSGAWSLTPGVALSDGNYSITAKATDAAGNTSSASTAVSVTVDVTAPSAPVITAPIDGTKTNDTTPSIAGTSEANADITVYRGGSTSICTTTADGSGDWSCDSASLAEGTYSITAKATDAQNNTSVASTAVSVTIDATAPLAPSITAPTDGTATADDTPAFSGTAEANATVEIFEGVSSLGTTTANGSGAWTFTPGTPLADATYSVTAKATDAAGNTGPASTAVSVTIDTAAPAAPVLTAPVTGARTNDTTPTVAGTSEANADITVYRGGSTSICTTTADGSGDWSCDSASLAEGTYSITAKATDAQNNTSVASSAVSITVDTTAPSAPAITSPTDGATTADDTPAFSGTAEANSTVEVFRGGSTSLGTTTANGSGAWSLTPGVALAAGTYSITAKATDVAGNTGVASSVVSITVDTTPPDAPLITAPTNGAKTKDTTPTITGTSEANADITVYRGGPTSICTTMADGSGDWSCDSASLAEGTYSITAKATDAQNNTSVASSAVSITIDTTAPSAPAITLPTDGTTTADNTPAFSGTAEANSIVELFRGGNTSLGTTTANGSGAWTITPGATISDGTYSITAKATDSADNTSVASTAISLTIDTAAPAAPSISSPTTGTRTNDTAPEISGSSEANATVEVFEGLNSLGTTTANGSGAWSLTPGAPLAEGTYSLTAQATDSGNNTSTASTAVSLTIDTTAPSAPSITAPTAGTTTSDDTPAISGTAEADATVEIFNGVSSLGTTTANGSGAWSFTPGSNLTDGSISLRAKATDVAGNESGFSTTVNITVDTTAPAAPSITSPTGGAKLTDTTPTISGSSEANATVELFEGSNSLGTTTANGSGAWSFTPSTPLSEGAYSLTAKATDSGNNTSDASSTVSITIDTTAPVAPSITSPVTGTTTSDNTPTFSGTAEANSTVELFRAGSTSLGTTTANGSGAWTFTPSSSIADGVHSITAKATDASTNTSAASVAVSLTIDASAPAAPSITSPSDGTATSDSTPTFSGTAEANSTVEIFEDENSLGSTTANGSGAWTFTPSSPLSDATYSITAKATDAAENTSAASSVVSIKVDTAAPSAPSITAPTNNTITADSTPAFTGTAEANSTVELFEGSNSIGTATANGSGAWTFTPGSALPDAAYLITARASDAANNTSAASSAVNVTIDTAAPAAPVISSPASGSSTSDNTPAFSGTAEANSTVEVFRGGSTSLGTTSANGSGAWSLTVGSSLTDGSYSITAKATDSANNASSASTAVALTVDTAAPLAPSITSPATGSTTNDSTPAFSGTAEANGTVELFRGGSVSLGTTTANGSGSWTITLGATLTDGTYSITAKVTDGVGNVSPASTAVSITIDTVLPAAPAILSPSDGAWTDDSTPTFSGTAEANMSIELFRGGSTSLGTTVANGSGAWSLTLGSALADATYSITAKATDSGNNTSLASTAVALTIDTAPPSAPSITSPADGLFTNDTTPTIAGSAEAASTVEIFDGASSLGTATADGSGNWTFTPGSALAEGNHSFSATATDAADNASVASASVGVTIDTTAPAAPVVSSPTTGSTTNDNTPAISGSAEANSTVEIFNGATSLGTTTASGAGSWTFTPGSALTDGAHSLTSKARDAAGNTSVASTAVSLTIDTIVPAAPVITAPATGFVTNDNTPAFSGTAEANGTVQIRDGATLIGTATANGSGTWSYTPSSAFSDAAHSITARVVDAGNNSSTDSAVVAITVDTTPPAAPSITAPLDGSSVNDSTPTISGTAEANSSVEIFDGVNLINTVTAAGDGTWSTTPSADIAQGAHTFRARATDGAGNVGADSSGVTVTVDSIAPAAPVITSPANTFVTSDSTPTFAGTAESNAVVSVYSSAVLLGTTSASGGGAWTFTPGAAMAEGAHTVSAKSADSVGNISAASAAVAITVDTIAPIPPVIILPTTGSEVNDATPTISGTVEPNAVVHLTLDNTVVANITSNNSGSWSYAPTTALPEGSHSVSATASDQVNTSASSTVVTFTVSLKFVISGYVHLANATKDPLPGVEVSDGTRVALTDNDGKYEIADVPTGTYTLTARKEGFGVKAGSETNPATLGTEGGLSDKDFTAKPEIENPVYVPWNGFIDMVNVMELVNTGSDAITATVTLFDLFGKQAGEPATFRLSAGTQFDIILNNLDGFVKDNYGLAKVELTADTFDGRLTYYRRAANKIDFDFGFPIPFMNAMKGNAYVTFNTYQPSGARAEAENLVVQWLTVVNVDPNDFHGYKINRYDLEGNVIWSNEIVLPPMGRYDVEGGHEIPGLNNVGLNEVIPDDPEAPYLLHLIRYGSNGPATAYPDAYDFAVALTGQTGLGRAHHVPISHTLGTDNYIEIVNVKDQTVSVALNCYDADGNLLDDSVITLRPRSQEHLYTSALIPLGTSGVVTLIPSQPDSIVAETVSYYRRAETGQILSAASAQASEPFGTVSFGSYNTFLGMSNWIRLINVTDNYASVTVNVNPYGESQQKTILLSPRSRIDYNLSQSSDMSIGSQGYGSIAVQSSEVGGIMAETLRVRKQQSGQIDFVSSSVMR